jgi:hypothetical protein
MSCSHSFLKQHKKLLLKQYLAWRQIYENDMFEIMLDQGIALTDQVKELVQGAEVTMWSEQVSFMYTT